MIISFGLFNQNLLAQQKALIEEAKFSKSQFLQLANKYQNNYRYSVYFESFAGFGYTVTVYIKNGIPHGREYLNFEKFGDSLFIKEEIREISKEVNFSETIPFKAVPFQELYDQCIYVWLTVKPENNYLYFSMDNLGILKNCSFTPKGCMDDCSTGVTIKDFEFLPDGFFDTFE